jgi:archaeosortase C (PEF-CTERM variant)
MPLRTLAGLGLIGYGLLVLLQVLPHDAPLAGALSLVVGSALLFGQRGPSDQLPRAVRRGRYVAVLGFAMVCGLIGYNVLIGSGYSLTEWAILGYGSLLMGAAPYLGRRMRNVEVGTLVAWSLPLLLAPLAMYAIHGVLSQGTGAAAADWVVNALVVRPTALLMAAFGTPVMLTGNSMIMQSPRGTLVLGVGLVCAGLYPMVLFTGLVAMHAWQQHIPGRRLALCLGAGLAGLWLLNVIRIVILAHVGRQWGGAVLQTTHAHLGWVLFAAFMLAFWALVLRRGQGTADAVPS